MLPHSLANFERQKYYQRKLKFNGAYSSNNLPKLKDEAYVRNLGKYKSIGTHWKTFYVNGDNNEIYLDSFGDIF